jgi:predicted HD phosphohydrolase
MHEIFHGYHYFHHQEGGDRNLCDNYKDHDFYQAYKDFCDVYDQTSFDENYSSLPLESFSPMVQRIFERKAYWWQPDHPKAGAFTG